MSTRLLGSGVEVEAIKKMVKLLFRFNVLLDHTSNPVMVLSDRQRIGVLWASS